MSKLCIVYNFAQLYREPIFTLIDKKWDCIWRFGKPEDGIKDMDVSKLKNAEIEETKYLPGGWKWQKGIVKLLKNKDIDSFLMLGELFNLSTWCTILLRPFIAPKKKIYFWSHGWYGREGFAKKWMKRAFFGLVDKTFLYGDYAKQMAIEQGNYAGKLVVIHNSLDYEEQLKLRKSLTSSEIYTNKFGNDKPVIIFIGRLTKSKKISQLFEAIVKLREKQEDYNIVLVGDGEDKYNLQDIAKENNLNVWFYGACYDQKKNAELIFNSDLCVSPGNVGLTAIHTMMFGCPVITHNDFRYQGPEFEAIKPNVTGSFFEKDNIDSLALTISDWFKSKGMDKSSIRMNCFKEIDSEWNPDFQMKVLEENIKL